MANIAFCIALGRAVELYSRVKSNDPANSALILIPIEAAGLETDAVLIDSATVAAVLAGATNEQATMGRKTLTDADLAAFPAPDYANNRFQISLPSVTWTAATGNAIAKILVAYDPDTTSGTDSSLIPLSMFDYAVTPSGTDLTATGAVFYQATAV